MKRNELWLGGLLAVAGFFGACTNVVEDESQNNKYPMELMAEKSAITFTRSIGEKTEWDGGESVSLYDGFSQKLYEVSQSGEMSAKITILFIGIQRQKKRLCLPGILLRKLC